MENPFRRRFKFEWRPKGGGIPDEKGFIRPWTSLSTNDYYWFARSLVWWIRKVVRSEDLDELEFRITKDSETVWKENNEY